jgi:hypothetical protein
MMTLFEDRLHVGLLEANRPADGGAIRSEVDGIREISIRIGPFRTNQN